MRFLTLSRIIVILIASITFALSVATIVGIILHGRVHWEMGDITVLRASHLGLPLTMAFLSLVVLLLALRRRWFDQVLNHLSLRDWLLGILLFLAGYAGISGRHTLHGDGREYILQTQALVGFYLLMVGKIRQLHQEII